VLRIAVPNKGVLSEPAAEMLAESGYRQRRSTKDLAVYDPDSDTEFFYLRPRDIAVYVAAGTLDVGITGRDMLLETAPATADGHAAEEVMQLGFGRSSFRFASPVESGIDRVDGRRERAGGDCSIARRHADQPPFFALMASVSFGRILLRSPTMPRSLNSKIGAFASLLIATMFSEDCMPTLCWIAPEMPAAR